MTAPKRAIAMAAVAMTGAFTVDELAALVRERDPAAGATATVYRAVSAMEASGFLERVGTRRGSALYARCGEAEHHHHIVCEGCGLTVAAECPVDTSALASSGFVLTKHEVTLYGLCPACAGAGGVGRSGAGGPAASGDPARGGAS